LSPVPVGNLTPPLNRRGFFIDHVFFLGANAGPTFAKNIAGNHLIRRSNGRCIFNTYRTPKILIFIIIGFFTAFGSR
jgi:hypothetical protein